MSHVPPKRKRKHGHDTERTAPRHGARLLALAEEAGWVVSPAATVSGS
ncbi:MAG: hypothetical protein ACRDJF_08090 [Actinomycetota bacterium]